jgi:gas vesicle structural protein
MTDYFEQALITSDVEQLEEADVSLLETLDHVLDRGLVIAGEITISVADIDLIFLGLNVLVSSVETANEVLRKRELEQSDSDKKYRKSESP